MKIGTLNFSAVDMSGAENIKIKMPSTEEVEKFKSDLGQFFRSLQEKGIVEIKKLNISLIDLSDAEEVEML